MLKGGARKVDNLIYIVVTCLSWLVWPLIWANHPRVRRAWNQPGRCHLCAACRVGRLGAGAEAAGLHSQSRGQAEIPQFTLASLFQLQSSPLLTFIVVYILEVLLKWNFLMEDREELRSEGGDELLVLSPFLELWYEWSSVQNKPSTIIFSVLLIVGWVWGFSICNWWFMKGKMCRVICHDTCRDHNMIV